MKDNNRLLQELEGDARTAMLYAYRYLLNREPEDIQWVLSSKLSWQELRSQFLQSAEFRSRTDELVSSISNLELKPFEKVFMQSIFLHQEPGSYRKKVLEIGCGEGRLTRAMAYYAPQAEVIGIDPYLETW